MKRLNITETKYVAGGDNRSRARANDVIAKARVEVLKEIFKNMKRKRYSTVPLHEILDKLHTKQ